MLKRTLTVVLVLATIFTTPHAAVARGHEQQRQECKFQWMQGGKWTQKEENATARCVVTRWYVSGGLAKLRAVGSCESGWNRLATNGRFKGLFQHMNFAQRARHYEPKHWTVKTSWRNSRSQIITTVRMVRDVGWWPWACA